ncbi:peptidoglycan DD-metalloendopeptidase family protein [Bacillus cereus]|uniref:peptidoglycan DD-metalloendopeptidase family protein n=1 Tax=Bacillus cereus TaxID=1396 RepID=UPI001E585B9E|nr:peptidoglycan DD-metalloendopeptidase family protein [Bacillus cereus]
MKKLACPPYNINQKPLHIYQNVPFSVPPNQINMITPCNTTHPGKDWRFNGAVFGTPVLAMESGTVLWATTGNPLCVCNTDDPNYFACLQKNCRPNSIGIISDVDGVVTEYVHIQPSVTKGKRVNAGQQIATLAATGTFTVKGNGSPTPHLHINRYVFWQTNDPCQLIYTCNFIIQGTNDTPPPPPPQCPNTNGWGLANGVWVFCQNGVRKGGWFPGSGGSSYLADNNGVWAGFIKTSAGKIQYRYLRDRNLPASDPNANRVARGWVCSLGQWWFFDNNGNMVTNTWELDSQGKSWFFGSNGACVGCPPCNVQS